MTNKSMPRSQPSAPSRVPSRSAKAASPRTALRARPVPPAFEPPDDEAVAPASGGSLRRWVDALSVSFRNPRAWVNTVWADTQPQDEAAGNPWGTTVLDDSQHEGGRH